MINLHRKFYKSDGIRTRDYFKLHETLRIVMTDKSKRIAFLSIDQYNNKTQEFIDDKRVYRNE